MTADHGDADLTSPSLYVAGACYGGLASAGLLRSLLSLRAACARQGIALQLDLGGGEALITRARAGMLARFLQSPATHLLLADGDAAIDVSAVVQSIGAGREVSELGKGVLLVSRAAGRLVADAHPELRAGLGDVRSPGAAHAVMVFESILDPGGGRYLTDLDAFAERHRQLDAGR